MSAYGQEEVEKATLDLALALETNPYFSPGEATLARRALAAPGE